VALKAREPEEAVRLLETARVYQLRAFLVLYTRAQAEAEAGMLDAAARDYRVILDNQGIDPISPLYSLSHLRLARVLRSQGKLDQAHAEYAAFFDAWREADADLPLLIQAKREYAALR
jgi:predicted negative regulator of RcsB-dependent stress response